MIFLVDTPTTYEALATFCRCSGVLSSEKRVAFNVEWGGIFSESLILWIIGERQRRFAVEQWGE